MLKPAPPVTRSEADMHLKEIKQRLSREQQLTGEFGMDVELTGVSSDSREIQEGDLFLAVRGESNDGHDYIRDAVREGAVAVVGERRPENLPRVIPFLQVRDSRIAGGLCADEFYGCPSDRMTVIGVTGTNGKTTTTSLVHSLLNDAGYRAGLIGTIENRVGDRVIPSDRTTPPFCQLHSLLERMKNEDCTHVVLEVSSHGLDQHRTAGVSFDAAVFTNLSRDHLDYHGSMDAYCRAKARLFEKIPEDGLGVVNADSEHGDRMADACDGRVVKYGRAGEAPYRGEIDEATVTGARWSVRAGEFRTSVDWSLTGEHNVENALAALATVHRLTGEAPGTLASGLERVSPVKGRLDPVEWDGEFDVLVDYAHTPDALENVLDGVRPLVEGSLRAVFGCGGDRDRGKRPLMGRTVEERADQLYVTSDNPRSEDPMRIIEDILEGIEHPGACHVEPDRRAAIERAVRDAEPGDAVLILGKGHETVQKQNGVVRPFKDWSVASDALEEVNGSAT